MHHKLLGLLVWALSFALLAFYSPLAFWSLKRCKGTKKKVPPPRFHRYIPLVLQRTNTPPLAGTLQLGNRSSPVVFVGTSGAARLGEKNCQVSSGRERGGLGSVAFYPGPPRPRPRPGEPGGGGGGAREQPGPHPAVARSPNPRGSHRPAHAAILQRRLPCQRCAWIAAASVRGLHDSTAPLLSRDGSTEKPQPGLRGRLRVAASVVWREEWRPPAGQAWPFGASAA